jgi:sulfite reductase alpha subunit-like flavoprotein
MATRFAVTLIGAGGLAIGAWALYRRAKAKAHPKEPAQPAPATAPPDPVLCVPTPTPAPTSAWPSIVHIVHDEGLAQELAERLAATPALQAGLVIKLCPCADFKKIGWMSNMRHVAVFIVSTLENEAPTEEAGACVRFFLRRTHPAGVLAGKLLYAVLGLGDSNLLLDRQTTTAKDCNQVAQKLERRLSELGGTALCVRGEADDRTGSTEIEPWLATLKTALVAACGAGGHAEGCTDACCMVAGRNRIRVPAAGGPGG